MYNTKNYTEQGGEVTHFGGKVIFEEGCEVNGSPAASAESAGVVKQAANQAASTAADVAGLKTDLNTLLASLKAAGIMAADAES